MKISRSEPGFPLSSAIHAGLLLAAFVLFSDAKKFDDAVEMVPVDIVTDSELTQIMKGEKTAREIKPTPRVDKVAPEVETKPEPPLAQAKKDIATPPPPVRPLPQPTADDAPPTPPKRVAALPPKPEPPPKPVEKQPEPKPVAKPKAAAPEPDKKEPEKKEPEDAEVVKPKPPTRSKPDNSAKDAAATAKPKERLKIDEVAKLLDSKKPQDKPEPETSIGELAEKAVKESKPKSGEENAPKSKFDAASISKLLSREAPQRKAATGRATQAAALGAPTGAAASMSASMEARIAAYIHDHYYPCWASGLSLGGQTYAPIVEFHLSRDGELEGRPKLLNASASPTEHARGEQAMQAVRRCSPMRIPPEFMPYYEEALREVTIRFQDSN
ncbi:cell envelope biogenesis protein TolA [Methylocystis sp. L43]|uniref:cell envelope biogenesis protein TolA n=1 Tax=unclassified Methylocystis TaxID=2625913 RepID=UPI0018C34B8E|nr:cell envelope biogenesis protein TolA [Methylocystis sp. L43]MBG0806397.1 cell envelope biogenesis protein TolA [Methylocystis sp. H15]